MARQLLRINGAMHRVRRRIDESRFNFENIESGECQTQTFEWLDEGWLNGVIEILPSKWESMDERVRRLVSADMETATVAMRRHALMMRPYVHALLDYRAGTLRPYRPLEQLWKEIADKRNRDRAPADYEKPPSRSSIFMFAKRYTDADHDLRALLPDFRTRGNRNARVSPILDDVIDELIHAIYLTPEARTKAALLAACIAHVKALNKTRHTADAEITEELPLPTRKMIDYRARKLERFDIDYYRKDPIKAEMLHRPVGLGPVATRINERWELDSTTLDLFVVDETTGAGLGRPTLTAVIDCASRLIVGWSITFESESALQVMLALHHAIAPKRFDDIELKLGNPARGIPEGIWMDNGKAHHSSSLRDALQTLNITPFWLPPKRPMLRGKIERWFGTIGVQLLHNLKGTSKSNPQKKGDYAAQANAIYTFKEVRWLLNFWICDVYNARPHRATRWSPHALWTKLSLEHPPVLPSRVSDLDVLLLQIEERSITPKGIEWKGLLYNSYLLNGIRGNQNIAKSDIKIRYNAANIGSLFVLAPGDENYRKIPCTNPRYAEGKTLYQHQAAYAHAKKLAEEGQTLSEADFENAWGVLVTSGRELMESANRKKTLNRLGQLIGMGPRLHDSTLASTTTSGIDALDWGKDASLSPALESREEANGPAGQPSKVSIDALHDHLGSRVPVKKRGKAAKPRVKATPKRPTKEPDQPMPDDGQPRQPGGNSQPLNSFEMYEFYYE